MTAVRQSARDLLCADLLELLDQLESDLTYDIAVDDAERDGAETVINAVCTVIDIHLFKNAGTRRVRHNRAATTGGAR